MTFYVVMLGYRKQSLSPEEFQAYYEEKHLPLIKTVAGPHFPTCHTRRYISRSADTSLGSTPAYEARILSDEQRDFDYDVIIELEFQSQDAFYKFSAVMSESNVRERVAEDCSNFLDESRAPAAIIGSVHTTRFLDSK